MIFALAKIDKPSEITPPEVLKYINKSGYVT